MKIVSIGLYNPIPVTSGSDSYINFILHPLSKKHSVTHYYFYKNPNNGGYNIDKPFNTRYLAPPPFFNFLKMPPFMSLLRPDLYIYHSLIRHVQSDVVLCDTFTFQIAYYLAKKNNSPLIMIKHNIEWKYVRNDGFRLYPLVKAYEQYTNKKSDVIITISMNDYKYVINHYRNQKVYYVPHQVNPRVFNPLGDAYPFGKDKFNVLFYGSLDRPMNINALIFIKHQLIPMLKQRNLMGKLRINIFGSGTPPEELGIENDEDINFLGLVDNPGYYIRGADVVIVPIKNNGGLKIRMLESLYCGKPVIATSEAVEGLSSELQKMVITRNNAAGFTDAIQEFVKSRTRRKTVKRNDQFWRYQMKGTSINYIIHNASRKNT